MRKTLSLSQQRRLQIFSMSLKRQFGNGLKQKKQQGDTIHDQVMDRWFGEKKEEWEIDYSKED